MIITLKKLEYPKTSAKSNRLKYLGMPTRNYFNLENKTMHRNLETYCMNFSTRGRPGEELKQTLFLCNSAKASPRVTNYDNLV